MEIRKGQKVRVTCTEARLKEVGVKQKHIKHILGKIGTVKKFGISRIWKYWRTSYTSPM
mgnify:CR=1 FL=1